MIQYFWFSTAMAISIATMSFGTAYIICKISNCPMDIPEYSSPAYNRHKLSRTDVCTRTVIFNAVELNVLISFLRHKHYLTLENNLLLQSFGNLLLYSIFIEFIYYMLHRLYHTQYAYFLHRLHHESYEVYPFDGLYLTIADQTSIIASFGIPAFFIQLNIYEFWWILYFYSTMTYLSHCPIIFHHHIIHHKRFKCNFSMVFPWFDYIFNTYEE